MRRACYQRRGEPALKRSGSDADRLAMADLELSAAEGRVEVARDWADPKVVLKSCIPSKLGLEKPPERCQSCLSGRDMQPCAHCYLVTPLSSASGRRP